MEKIMNDIITIIAMIFIWFWIIILLGAIGAACINYLFKQ